MAGLITDPSTQPPVVFNSHCILYLQETLMEYYSAKLLVTAHQRKVGADIGNVHHT